MRISIIILSLVLFGCAGQSDMERMLSQMQYSYAEGRKTDFEQKSDEILAQVKAKDLDYLIANTGSAATNELGEEGLRKYYQENIFTHLSNGFEFDPKGNPQVTFDEADNVGYAFLFKAASENCEGVFQIVVISYTEKLKIRGMSFKYLTSKGSGCVATLL